MHYYVLSMCLLVCIGHKNSKGGYRQDSRGWREGRQTPSQMGQGGNQIGQGGNSGQEIIKEREERMMTFIQSVIHCIYLFPF